MIQDMTQYQHDWYQRNKIRLRAVRSAHGVTYRRENVDTVRAYNKRRRKENADFINSTKDRPCTDCHQRFPPYVMEFDHLGDKKENVSWMKGWNRSKIVEEIAKCEIVCSNCHRVRTETRRGAKCRSLSPSSSF